MRNAYEKGVAIGRALGRTEVVAAVEALVKPPEKIGPPYEGAGPLWSVYDKPAHYARDVILDLVRAARSATAPPAPDPEPTPGEKHRRYLESGGWNG